jgi:type IV pilus assembly protein PilM
VVAQAGKLVFARNLAFGAAQIDKAAEAALKLPASEVAELRRRFEQAETPPPEAEALYQAIAPELDAAGVEITKCLRYYDTVFPSHNIERAIFLGGQACDRAVCQQLAQRLNLPAQIGDPLARIGGTAEGLDRRRLQPAWAVAVGLSLSVETPAAA